MSLSLYQTSVPVFERSLNAFLAILDKAEAHAEAPSSTRPSISPLRLRPDMLPFARQVQTFCDHAKNARSRLRGRRAAARSRTTRRRSPNLQGAHPEDARRSRQTSTPRRSTRRDARNHFPRSAPTKAKMLGRDYLAHFVLPNFYFHLTTAYDILRYAGVAIGKRDFIGRRPGLDRRLSIIRHVMSIQRIGVGPRMSQAVVHGDTVYLAGQVADQPAGKSVGEQTQRDSRPRSTSLLAEAGPTRPSCSRRRSISPTSRPSRDERGVGRLGRQGTRRRAPPSRPSSPRRVYTVEIACIAAKA